MYVLDTNTLIYFFKGVGEVPQRMLAVSPDDIGIPAVVLYELSYGIAKSNSPEKRRQQMAEICSFVHLLPFGVKEANFAAIIRAKLEKEVRPIGPYDLLIAGTALARNGVLVTNNTKEFSRIAELTTENWLS
jgi:tRNA(fMet)-specific endonuclease VapC